MFPSRREFILAFASMHVLAVEGNAQIAKLTPSSRAKMLKNLSLAMGGLALAIKAVAEGIASLGKTADSGWSELSARRTRQRLTDISARAAVLASENQSIVINGIDGYLEKSKPTVADWLALTQPLNAVVSDLKVLLDELREERSDFIAEPAYAILVQALDPAQLYLSQLQTLPPPTTAEEREALLEIKAKYKILLENLQSAVRELNAYIRRSH